MLVEGSASVTSHCRTSFPSGVSVSADGQILVLTHSYLHIVTPALGLSVRADGSALSGLPGNKTADQWSADKLENLFGSSECKGMPVYKNIIEVANRNIEWEDYSNDPRSTVPGGLDNGWRMATWSPSGLTELGGCFVAALNVNREVYVFAPGQDPIKATWSPMFDITTSALNALLDEEPEILSILPRGMTEAQRSTKDHFVHRIQATALAWSPAAPSHATRDDSLLAVAHRNGDVTFWRYDGRSGMTFVCREPIADKGCLVMAWNQWSSETETDAADGKVTQSIQLALGGPWGHIKLLLITVAHDGSINVDVERSMLSSAKTTTALRWISPSQLAVGRVGEVVLWTPSSSRNLQIPIETFNGWTSIANPLDIWAVDRTDQLVVALADGTFRTFSNPWTTPMVDPLHSDETSDNPTSLQLCEQVRKSFLAVERASVKLKSTGTITAGAAMIVSGCVALDSSGTFFMAYERHNLDARVYSMATLHKSALLFGRMFESDGPDVELLLSNVRAVLTNPKPGVPYSSARTLFPIFLGLRHFHKNRDMGARLLDILTTSIDLSYAPPASVQRSGDYTAFLLSNEKLHAIRLAGLIARYCLKYIAPSGERAAAREVAEKITSRICLLVFTALCRTLDLHGTISNFLYSRFQQIITSLSEAQGENERMDLDVPQTERPAEVFTTELDQLDRCAACSEVIGFDRLGKATCRNGHEWLRCSITLAVLSTAAARTCTVCSRKSRVPAVHAFAVDEAETAAQALLKMARSCLFCGGRWSMGY